ncbi:uncharacterized protein F5147DRAFT_776824 [Suillus discolor]|uniref:Uncharacterized protein n=1 Tax=Suillus discolor TaxID=1912936 RepID=A0A9P7F2A6_9AGAM|nr:uncharacterized protein F5147DRAFT_776824 [Suillus discolor]KAG2101097.1 hypothetical protein F5147DRAFT_776824 [Suillus discolor]
MTSGGSPGKSIGLPKERGKVRKDYPDPDECEKLPEGCRKVPEELLEITMRMDTEERLQGQSPKQNRSGGMEEQRIRGSEERRSGGAEERRSGGAEERSSGLGNSSLGLRWILTKSED